MKRRDFIKSASIAVGSSSLAAAITGKAIQRTQSVHQNAQIRPDETPPNILIIYTDQQNYNTLSCLGSSIIDTPNIDRIGHEGAILSNFYTNVAVCTPSRGCFLTGRYHHSHGASVNGRPINQDEITFAEILQGQGYDTGYAGKWHLDGYNRRPGWVNRDRAMGFNDCHYMFNDYHGKNIQRDIIKQLTSKIINHNRTVNSPTSEWLEVLNS
jgi:uncharacterized sulfatase